MAPKSVFRSLQEVFPQIDTRILRAVAAEFSRDVDAAVEFVLSDVLPIISEPVDTSNAPVATDAGYWSCDNPVGGCSPDKGANVGNRSSYHNENAAQEENLDQGATETNGRSYCDKGQKERLLTYDPNPKTVESETNCVAEHRSDALDVTLSGNHSNALSDNLLELSQISGAKCDAFLDANTQHLCKTNTDDTNGVSLDYCPTLSSKPFEVDADPMDCEARITKYSSSCKYLNYADSAITISQFQCSAKSKEHEKQSLVSLEDVVKCNTMLPAFTNTEGSQSACAVFPVHSSEKLGEYVDSTCFQSGTKIHYPGHQTEIDVAQLLLINDSLSAGNDLLGGTASASEEDISKDFLDGVNLDLQNVKDSASESSIDMLKEVKLHEELTEQAKIKVSMTVQDVKKSIDDLMQMIIRAKVLNTKAAEEINAEKYKIDSETTDLEPQLIMLSDQIKNSLSVVVKARETLGSRFALPATEELAATEKEKLNKEDITHKLLIEQESIMNSLVQEASCLHKEAEEICKLRKVLIVNRRVLDMLQEQVAPLREAVLLVNHRVEGWLQQAMERERLNMIDKETKDPPSECHHQDGKEQSDDEWEILEGEEELD